MSVCFAADVFAPAKFRRPLGMSLSGNLSHAIDLHSGVILCCFGLLFCLALVLALVIFRCPFSFFEWPISSRALFWGQVGCDGASTVRGS